MPTPNLSALEIQPARSGALVPALGVPDTLEVVLDPVTGTSATFDALGEQYEAMAPGQFTAETVLIAQQAGVPSSTGSPLQWFEVLGGKIQDGHTVVARTAQGDPALFATYVVVAVGGVSYSDAGWADPDDPGKGRLGPVPYVVVPCTGDALGRATMLPADLAPAGGRLQPQRGDVVVLVRCVPRPPVLLWSRDEPGRPRVSGGVAPALLVGGGPAPLGPYAPGAVLRLNPPPSSWPVGRALPGNPRMADGLSLLRAGSSPGVSSKPLSAIGVPPGTLVEGLDFSSFPAVDALVETVTGRCMVRPGSVPEGTPLWHVPLSFSAAGSGEVLSVGKDLFAAPVPEEGEVPFFRIGERMPLDVATVGSDAELKGQEPRPGSALVSRTTGRVLLSAVEAALVAGGAVLRYLGVFLGSARQPTAVQVPPAAGFRVVPAGSLSSGKAGMLRSPTGGYTLSDGVGVPLVVPPRGMPLQVTEVDLDAKLPPAAPAGQAVVSQQSGKMSLPPVLAASAVWVSSSTSLLRRFAIPRLRSMVRHTFVLSGIEKLWLGTPARTFQWSAVALGPGAWAASDVAASLAAAVDPKIVAVSAEGGYIFVAAVSSWVEVLWGRSPAARDLSGCAALGLAPGWRTAAANVDLGVAVGLPADGVALARRFSGSVRDPVDPLPVVVTATKPLEDDPGLQDGSALWLERGGDQIPIRIGTDAAYDSSGGRVIWAARGSAEAPVASPVVRMDLSGLIDNTMRVEMSDASGSVVLDRGKGYDLDPGGVGEVRLLEGVGLSSCAGDRGVLKTAPSLLADPSLDPACAVPGSRLRAGSEWFRIASSRPGQALLDRVPASPGACAWEVRPPPAGPLDPSILADLSLVPVDYRGAYDIRVTLTLPGSAPRELVLGSDFTIDPLGGLLALLSPLPPGATLHASGYGADGTGARTDSFDLDALLSSNKVDARRISTVEYRFGERGPRPDAGSAAAVRVYVLGQPTNRPDAQVDYPPDLQGSGRVSFPTDVPPDGARVQVTYQSKQAAGGERVVQLPVRPVFASFVRLPAGQSYIGLRGDRTASFGAGRLLRIGASCFWVTGTTYYPARPGGGDATRVDLVPTPEQNAGSAGPADRVLLLCTDRPIAADPVAWVSVEVVGPLAPGSAQVVVRGIRPGQILQPGCILEINGHPYAVASAQAGQPGEVQVVLTTGLLRATVAAPASARVTARPAYPPGVSSFAGFRVFTGPEPTVVLWPSNAPGRSLSPGTEVDVDKTTGEVRLLGGISLPPGGRLEIYGQALALVQPDAQGRWPLLRVSNLRMVQPIFEPGDKVAGSYLYFAPDALRYYLDNPMPLRALAHPLLRAGRQRAAEIEDQKAADDIARAAALGRHLQAALGLRASVFDVSQDPEDSRRVALGRPRRGPDALAAAVSPALVRATIEPGPYGWGPLDAWVPVGQLAHNGERLSGVVHARASKMPDELDILEIRLSPPAIRVDPPVGRVAIHDRPLFIRSSEHGILELRTPNMVPLVAAQTKDAWVIGFQDAEGMFFKDAGKVCAGILRLAQVQLRRGDRLVFGRSAALRMGADLDVDEDGTVYMPREAASAAGVVVDAKLAAPVIRVPSPMVAQPEEDLSPEDAGDTEESRLLSSLDLVATALLGTTVGQKLAAGAATRVCLGRGVAAGSTIDVGKDFPTHRVLPGDILTIQGCAPVQVVAVPPGADPGRARLRANPGPGPRFAPEGKLLLGAEVPPGAVAFEVDRRWADSAQALVAPILQRLRAEHNESAESAAVVDKLLATLGPEFEDLGQLAAGAREESSRWFAELARMSAFAGAGEGLPDAAAFTAAIRDRRRDLAERAARLRRLARPGGAYHEAVKKVLARRYDPGSGTAAALRRIRGE